MEREGLAAEAGPKFASAVEQNGVYVFHKPKGWVCNRFLQMLKRRFGLKKLGHLGTLDPIARGVLPVFAGKTTKLVPYFEDCDKTYSARAKFGFVSDTYDAEGTVSPIPRAEFPERGRIEAFLRDSLGKTQQTPPAFSAVKIDGKRAYEQSRRGKEVSLPSREVTVFHAALERYRPPEADIFIHCSKGFYVRSFIHEMGKRLGCGAVMTDLNRLACGGKISFPELHPT